MRQTSYRFIEVTKLPPETMDQVIAAIKTGAIRLVKEEATGKQYVDGAELHKILGFEHGIAGYVDAD